VATIWNANPTSGGGVLGTIIRTVKLWLNDKKAEKGGVSNYLIICFGPAAVADRFAFGIGGPSCTVKGVDDTDNIGGKIITNYFRGSRLDSSEIIFGGWGKRKTHRDK